VENSHITDLINQIKASQTTDPSLSRRLSELISLNELVTSIHFKQDLQEILEVVLFTILGQYPSRTGAVLVRDYETWRVGQAKGLKRQLDLSRFKPERELDQSDSVITIQNAGPVLSKFMQNAGFELAFPMVSQGQLVGIIALGGSMLNPIESEKIALIASIAAFSAIVVGKSIYRSGLEQLNRRLQRGIFQMKTLYEIAGSFARCYDNDSVFQILSKNLMGLFFVSRCAVLATEPDLRPIFWKGVRPGPKPIHEGSEAKQCLDRVGQEVRLIEEIDDPELTGFMRRHKLLYAIQIGYEQRVFGLLLLGNRLDNKLLTSEDGEFLASLVQQAAVSLENVNLHLEVLEKKRMERELEVARGIQHQLLPKHIPQIDCYDIAVMIEPYHQVGGDFYDLIPLKDGRLAVCMADVSGKSLPASMIMSTAQACLHALTSYDVMGPREVIARLNEHLYRSTQSNKFVTLFFGILDPKNHTLTYINAGHNRPFLITPDGHVRELDRGGMVVGLFPNPRYETETVDLPPGAELLIFTDGLSEIQDSSGVEFGENRLVQILLQLRGTCSATRAKDFIMSSALDFGSNQTDDDLTLLVLHRKSDADANPK